MTTDPLDVLVGEWSVQVGFPDTPVGRTVFEWDLDGRFLVQRSEVPDSPYPSSLSIIARDGDTGGYLQHYFDSRGVVRVYRMRLDGGVWTLLRDEPDFTPLNFAQRFEGVVSADRTTIEARWERSDDGETWKVDFPLTYTRVT